MQERMELDDLFDTLEEIEKQNSPQPFSAVQAPYMQGFHLFDILMAILRVSIPTVTVGVVVGAELLMMLGRFEQAIIRQFDRIQLPSGFRSAIADPVVFWGFAWLIMQDLMLFCHAAPAARKKVDHTVLYFEVGKFTSISRSVCLVALLRWILTGVFLNWFEVTRTMFLISMPLISFIVNFMGQSLFLQYHLKPVQRIVRSFIGAIMFSISTGWFSWASAIVLYMNSLSPIYSGIAKASVFLILRFVGVAFLTSILNRLRTTEVFNAKANLKKRRGALGKNQKVAPDEAKVDSDKAQKEDLDEADINGTKEGSEKKNETPAKQSAKPDPKASFITFFSSTENVMDSEEANEIGLNTSALVQGGSFHLVIWFTNFRTPESTSALFYSSIITLFALDLMLRLFVVYYQRRKLLARFQGQMMITGMINDEFSRSIVSPVEAEIVWRGSTTLEWLANGGEANGSRVATLSASNVDEAFSATSSTALLAEKGLIERTKSLKTINQLNSGTIYSSCGDSTVRSAEIGSVRMAKDISRQSVKNTDDRHLEQNTSVTKSENDSPNRSKKTCSTESPDSNTSLDHSYEQNSSQLPSNPYSADLPRGSIALPPRLPSIIPEQTVPMSDGDNFDNYDDAEDETGSFDMTDASRSKARKSTSRYRHRSVAASLRKVVAQRRSSVVSEAGSEIPDIADEAMPKRFSAVQKGGTGSRRASLVMPAEEMFNFAVNRAMEMDNDGIIAMDAGKVKIGGERRRNIGEVGKAGKVEGNDGDRPSRADQGRSSRRTSASIRRSTATGRGVRRPPDISDPLATSTSLPNSNDTLASLSPRRTTTQKVPKPLSILQRMSTSASQGSKSNIDENKIIVGTPSGQYEDPQLEINDAWLRQAACAMQLSVGSYLAIIGAVMVCFIFATNDGIFPAKCEKGHSDISRQTIALRGCVVVLMQVSVDLVVFSVGERMGFRYMLASQIKIPLVIVVGMGLNVASLASNLMMAFRGEADGIFFAEKRECLPI